MTNVITAAHDVASIREIISPTANPSLIDETRTDVVGHQRADSLTKRLRVVLLDLGLDGVVPNCWVEASIDGLNFSSLTLKQADRLVRALEELAVDHVVEVPEPGPGQLSLFEGGLQ